MQSVQKLCFSDVGGGRQNVGKYFPKTPLIFSV